MQSTCIVSCLLQCSMWTIEFDHWTDKYKQSDFKEDQQSRTRKLTHPHFVLTFDNFSNWIRSNIYCFSVMQTSAVIISSDTQHSHRHTGREKKKREGWRKRHTYTRTCIDVERKISLSNFLFSLSVSLCVSLFFFVLRQRSSNKYISSSGPRRCENEWWTSWRQHLLNENLQQRMTITASMWFFLSILCQYINLFLESTLQSNTYEHQEFINNKWNYLIVKELMQWTRVFGNRLLLITFSWVWFFSVI